MLATIDLLSSVRKEVCPSIRLKQVRVRSVERARQAAEPMRYLNYSESANLISIRLSEGAKRMSLSKDKRTAKACNYKCPLGVLLA